MKKFIKLISCSVVMAALIISTQICAMAAVTSEHVSSQVTSSYPTVSDINPIAESRNDTVSGANSGAVSGASHLNNIASNNNTTNPRTGGQNLVIPGVVAMIAAATAAVTLAGKKK